MDHITEGLTDSELRDKEFAIFRKRVEVYNLKEWPANRGLKNKFTVEQLKEGLDAPK